MRNFNLRWSQWAGGPLIGMLNVTKQFIYKHKNVCLCFLIWNRNWFQCDPRIAAKPQSGFCFCFRACKIRKRMISALGSFFIFIGHRNNHRIAICDMWTKWSGCYFVAIAARRKPIVVHRAHLALAIIFTDKEIINRTETMIMYAIYYIITWVNTQFETPIACHIVARHTLLVLLCSVVRLLVAAAATLFWYDLYGK